MKEGYTKFHLEWVRKGEIPKRAFLLLNDCRTRLHNQGLVGSYEDKGKIIGFGNISIRKKDTKKFFITGTQTGSLKKPYSKGLL